MAQITLQTLRYSPTPPSSDRELAGVEVGETAHRSLSGNGPQEGGSEADETREELGCEGMRRTGRDEDGGEGEDGREGEGWRYSEVSLQLSASCVVLGAVEQ